MMMTFINKIREGSKSSTDSVDIVVAASNMEEEDDDDVFEDCMSENDTDQHKLGRGSPTFFESVEECFKKVLFLHFETN